MFYFPIFDNCTGLIHLRNSQTLENCLWYTCFIQRSLSAASFSWTSFLT